jgi:hypothetical protein
MGLKVDSKYMNIMIRPLKPIVAEWGMLFTSHDE